MKLNHFIDTNKGLTCIVILLLMGYYRQWDNPTAWVYLALHGSYGILWVIKTRLFPDANWVRPTSLWFGLVSWTALMLYWIPAWLLTSRGVQAPAWILALSILMFTFGNFFHFTSDMQKYVQLRFAPGELITDGFLGLSRNINYFGEFLTYAAFALLPLTWLAYLPLLLFILTFWIPSILKKERILAGLPGYAEYRRRVKSFFPFLF